MASAQAALAALSSGIFSDLIDYVSNLLCGNFLVAFKNSGRVEERDSQPTFVFEVALLSDGPLQSLLAPHIKTYKYVPVPEQNTATLEIIMDNDMVLRTHEFRFLVFDEQSVDARCDWIGTVTEFPGPEGSKYLIGKESGTQEENNRGITKWIVATTLKGAQWDPSLAELKVTNTEVMDGRYVILRRYKSEQVTMLVPIKT